MKKIFYLKSCSTCKRIMDSITWPEDISLQNIKETNVSEKELKQIKAMSGNYESLFSRKAMKYRSLGLNEEELKDDDYQKYILEEYTFLKRPVVVYGNRVFIGNSKKNIEEMQVFFKDLKAS